MTELKLWVLLPILAATVALPGLTIEQRYAAVCAGSGFMGGCAFQLCTTDKRKPPWKVIAGDLIFSIAFGFGTFALTMDQSYATVCKAFFAGASGSLTWWAIVKKGSQFFPTLGGGKDGGQ